MPTTPVSVNLLVKNCAQKLRDCLTSLRDFLRPTDEIVVVDTGSTDGGATLAVCREFGCKVIERPDLNQRKMSDLVKTHLPEVYDEMSKDPSLESGFLADFAAARQICMEHSSNDVIFWLDSDDVLLGGPALRDYVDQAFAKSDRSCIFLAYDYSFDDDGTCNTVLWRERVVNRRLFTWKGVCHESLIPLTGKPTGIDRVPYDLARISHKNGRAHVLSDLRNYAILREAWDHGEWKDPRWAFYLGNACRGLRRYQEAINWYSITLQRSGSPEDRQSAVLNIGYAHLLFGRPWKAIDWFFQAMKIIPADPRSYFGVARAYFELKRYPDCLRWTQIGQSLPRPDFLTAVDPNHFDFYPKIFETLSLKELNLVEPALRCAKEAAQLRPTLPATKELVTDIQGWAQREAAKKAVAGACSLAFSNDAVAKIIHALRPEVRKAIPDLQLEVTATPPHRSLTFLCGEAIEPWDHTSAQDGIGGSEKMVILLSTELAKRGWKIDVYGNPRPGNAYKSFSGVVYRPAQSFNHTFPRDNLVIWRVWQALDFPLKANRLFIDLHDVQDPSNLTPQRVARLDAAIFKSAYHAESVKELLGPKAVILRNAIEPAHFQLGDPPPARDPFRIMFASSADRGLKRALRLFARLRTIDHRFSFHWYYGFTPMYLKKSAQFDYQFFGDEQCERHMLDYAEECFTLSDKLGAVQHGRIGHQDLARELLASGCLLYPTRFPEISCMIAMEAQAAGCIPVVSDFAALHETVKHGVLCDPDRDDDFIKAVYDTALKGADLDDQRRAMSAAAIADFNIKDLADAWERLLTSPPKHTDVI